MTVKKVTSSGITAREPQQNPVLVFSITLTQKRVRPPIWIILVLHAELASVRAFLSKAFITPTSHPLSNLCAMYLPCCMHTHKQKSENANANSHEHISTSRARTHTHTHTRKHQHRHLQRLAAPRRCAFVNPGQKKIITRQHPGRLRSWSGPVETDSDFQGRPRFS